MRAFCFGRAGFLAVGPMEVGDVLRNLGLAQALVRHGDVVELPDLLIGPFRANYRNYRSGIDYMCLIRHTQAD